MWGREEREGGGGLKKMQTNKLKDWSLTRLRICPPVTGRLIESGHGRVLNQHQRQSTGRVCWRHKALTVTTRTTNPKIEVIVHVQKNSQDRIFFFFFFNCERLLFTQQ